MTIDCIENRWHLNQSNINLKKKNSHFKSVPVQSVGSNYLVIPKLWEWINNVIRRVTIDVIVYPCWDWSSSMLVKGKYINCADEITPLNAIAHCIYCFRYFCWFQFRFATKWDRVLQIIGTICAIFTGAANAIQIYLLSRVINDVIAYDIVQQNA